MYLNEKWTNNVTLVSLDGDTSDADSLKVVWATFSFYDCEYTAAISQKDIDQDSPMTALEGDTILFDSFESLIESDENWEKLKLCFEKYKNYLIDQENED